MIPLNTVETQARVKNHTPNLRPTPSALPEFKLYKPRAGDPDWVALQAEAEELYRTLRPTLELPQSGIPMLKRRAQSYWTALDNYRINRRLDREGREDLLPLYFIWTTTRVCNFACTYCDDHRGRKYPDLPNDGVLTTEQGKTLLKVMRTRTPSLYFAGGEPTARKDLPELTRAARDMNYYPIIINTNGSLVANRLKKKKWATWLADTDIVLVSLDSLKPALTEKMWVYRKPVDVYRNLLLLRLLAKEMDFKLMVNVVIQPGQIQEARAVLDFVNDMGIWFTAVPVNIGPTVDQTLQTDPEYKKLVDTILERKDAGYLITGSKRMNTRLLNSAPLNCRNTLKPHIDFDGNLVWPCKATVNVEPEYVNVLEHEHVDQLYAAACKRVDPRGFHGPAKNQCGAECNWAQNYSTDTYLHGIRNPISLLGEVVEFLGA